MAHDVPIHRHVPAVGQPMDMPEPRTLHGWATAALTVSILLGLAGVATGLTVALTTRTSEIGFDSTTYHPYASQGVALIVASVVQTLIIGVLCQWAILYAEVTARRLP